MNEEKTTDEAPQSPRAQAIDNLLGDLPQELRDELKRHDVGVKVVPTGYCADCLLRDGRLIPQRECKAHGVEEGDDAQR